MGDGMKKPSHIPVFPDAYLRDTTHLSCEEHGAYFLLMMAAWGADDCTIPNDERRLAALVKVTVAKWRKMAPNVLEFWTIERGRLSQKRLLKEWNYVREKSGKRRAAATVRWSEGECKSNANAMHLGGGEGEGEGGGPIQEISYPYESLGDDGQNAFSVIKGGK